MTESGSWKYCHWLRGDARHGELPVSRLSMRALAAWIAVIAAGMLALGSFMAGWTNAAVPYPDAFIAVASLVAQWLMARKKLESWLFWITVDVAAIGVYFWKELYLTTGLYAVFLVLAALGFFSWRRSYRTRILEDGHDDGADARQVRSAASGASAAD